MFLGAKTIVTGKSMAYLEAIRFSMMELFMKPSIAKFVHNEHGWVSCIDKKEYYF